MRDQPGKLSSEASLGAVILEVLLRLVEHEEQIAGERIRPASEGLGQRFALTLVEKGRSELRPELRSHSGAQASHRIVIAPRGEQHDHELRMAAFLHVSTAPSSQAVCDAG